MFVSVIIPTRNNCSSLRNAVRSVQLLDFPTDSFEIIVIDNNSSDHTNRVIEECNQHGYKEVIYFKEFQEGLHNARHAGARIAKGEVLAYVDDDVVCHRTWLSELVRPYEDLKVGCVGGRIVPRYETREPAWAKWFPSCLSILDRADEITVINDNGIWGCNFSIRKSVLYDVGGFHPDAMPWDLIRYRGDGESGLLSNVIEKAYEVVYTPFAVVDHVIPKKRATLGYFKKRAFTQGISDSYTQIRRSGGVMTRNVNLFASAVSVFFRCRALGRAIYTGGLQYAMYEHIFRKYHEKGAKYHKREASKDKELLEFILRTDYLNMEPHA